MARDPWTGGVAKIFISEQILYRPILHCVHLQQLIPGSRATRSTGTRSFTLLRISLITPAHSYPIPIGSFTTKYAHLNVCVCFHSKICIGDQLHRLLLYIFYQVNRNNNQEAPIIQKRILIIQFGKITYR